MMLERAAIINLIWFFPYYCQKHDSPNNWGFRCADSQVDFDIDLPLKYENRFGGRGIHIMQYLIKNLPKEASDIFKNYRTDGHAVTLLPLNNIHLMLILLINTRMKTLKVLLLKWIKIYQQEVQKLVKGVKVKLEFIACFRIALTIRVMVIVLGIMITANQSKILILVCITL